jgi:chromosome segregation ATPase
MKSISTSFAICESHLLRFPSHSNLFESFRMSSSIRGPLGELCALSTELVAEQCRQETQIESAVNELRRWKGLVLRQRTELATYQSQLGVSSSKLRNLRQQTHRAQEELNQRKQELRSLEAEIKLMKKEAELLRSGVVRAAQLAPSQLQANRDRHYDPSIPVLLPYTKSYER